MYAFRDCISNELLHTIFLYIMNNRAREEKVINLVFFYLFRVCFSSACARRRARAVRARAGARACRESVKRKRQSLYGTWTFSIDPAIDPTQPQHPLRLSVSPLYSYMDYVSPLYSYMDYTPVCTVVRVLHRPRT